MYISLRDWTTSGYSQCSVGACCWPEGKQSCWRTWIISEFTLFPDKLQLGKKKKKKSNFHLQNCLHAFELHHFTWKKSQVKKWSPRLSKVKKVPAAFFSSGKGREGTSKGDWDFFSGHGNISMFSCFIAIRNISIFLTCSPVMPLCV